MDYYDIIGDIHGYASKLRQLLDKLGYVERSGCYQHESRIAIFVGDYIDRGPEQAEVIAIVKAMVDSGSALAIMGNHEFNAVCYATLDPTNPGQYLRKHNDGNYKQHQAFLNEFPLDSQQHTDTIEWFKTLPVYLDLEHIRVVHACWHQPAIVQLKEILNEDNTIPDDVFVTASRPEHAHFRLIEDVVKSPEVKLPDDFSFLDSGKKNRTYIRVKWWAEDIPTYRNLALSVPAASLETLPDRLVEGVYTYDSDKPVFFGHYWMQGECIPQTDKVACTDYSVAKGGDLVAYRWSGESVLDAGNYVRSN